MTAQSSPVREVRAIVLEAFLLVGKKALELLGIIYDFVVPTVFNLTVGLGFVTVYSVFRQADAGMINVDHAGMVIAFTVLWVIGYTCVKPFTLSVGVGETTVVKAFAGAIMYAVIFAVVTGGASIGISIVVIAACAISGFSSQQLVNRFIAPIVARLRHAEQAE